MIHKQGNIKELYKGGQKIKEVYKGEQLVYTAVVDPRSYWISTSGVKSYFDQDNTPIANFVALTSVDPEYKITINGVSTSVNTVKKLVFGESYNTVTSLPNSCLRHLIELESLDIRGLSGVETIGNLCFFNLFKLEELDLSPLANVISTGNSFAATQPSAGSNNLVKIKIGNNDWSGVSVGSNGFINRAFPPGTIYASTTGLANTFKAKFSNLSNWSVAVG